MDILTTLGIKKHPIEKDEETDDTWIDEKLSIKNHLIFYQRIFLTL